MRDELRVRYLCLVLWMATPASLAFAVDGVLEINQACAVNTGCFSGDAPGFPVTVSQTGSYRLTGSLSVSGGNVTAIEVTSSHVSLDLGGFTIGCSGGTCGTGTGRGVFADSAARNVRVVSGSVNNMGDSGIHLAGAEARVEGVDSSFNGGDGIRAASGSTVINSTVSFNDASGIQALGGGCVVSGNVASDNGVNGIEAGTSCTISANTAKANGADGIRGHNGTVRGNTANGNGGDGIDVGGVDDGATVLGNTSSKNTGFGLRVSQSTSGAGNNVFSDNNGGNLNPQIAGSFTQIGTNQCGTDTTCP